MKLEGKIAPNRGKGPVRVVGEVAKKDADLGKIAKRVNGASTPHKSLAPPGLAVVLFAKLNKDSAGKAVKALKKVKGVDANKSKADAQKGEISAKLSGTAKVTAAQLTEALKGAGIEASLTKAKE